MLQFPPLIRSATQCTMLHTTLHPMAASAIQPARPCAGSPQCHKDLHAGCHLLLTLVHATMRITPPLIKRRPANAGGAAPLPSPAAGAPPAPPSTGASRLFNAAAALLLCTAAVAFCVALPVPLAVALLAAAAASVTAGGSGVVVFTS